jgi:hypothetical protein
MPPGGHLTALPPGATDPGDGGAVVPQNTNFWLRGGLVHKFWQSAWLEVTAFLYDPDPASHQQKVGGGIAAGVIDSGLSGVAGGGESLPPIACAARGIVKTDNGKIIINSARSIAGTIALCLTHAIFISI